MKIAVCFNQAPPQSLRGEQLDRISEAVGRTPLLRLHRSVEGLGCEAFAKLEFLNPMGSVKDRIARYMVEKAIQEGRLESGGTVIENSSGNTGASLAMIAAVKTEICSYARTSRAAKARTEVESWVPARQMRSHGRR